MGIYKMSNSIVAMNAGAIKVRSFKSYGEASQIKIKSNLNLTGNLTVSETLKVLKNDESINSDTGSLVVKGGMGVTKNVNVNGNLNISNGALFVNSGEDVTSVKVGIGTEAPRTSLDILGGARNASGTTEVDVERNLGEDVIRFITQSKQ